MNETIKFALKLSTLLLLFVASTRGQFVGDSCTRHHDNTPGVCKFATDCEKVRLDYERNGIKPQICAIINRKSIVCCPEEIRNVYYPTTSTTTRTTRPTFTNPSYQTQPSYHFKVDDYTTPRPTTRRPIQPNQRISVQKCEEYSRLMKKTFQINTLIARPVSYEISTSECVQGISLITGGEKALAGEFPHMAAIGWTNQESVDFACGGVLVSERYVLTAAHCSRRNGISPDVVRLGDQNLNNYVDDGAQPQEFKILEFIKHEDYRSRYFYHDIAIIKLDGEARFNKFVRPACLWQTHSVNSSKAVATGFGAIEFGGDQSTELLKVSLDIIDNYRCNSLNLQSRKLPNGIVSSQMCAGFLAGGKDTCEGDSGGPLVITSANDSCIFHVVGLTSFGSTYCGGQNSPGVYTRISSYIPWIESVVWGS